MWVVYLGDALLYFETRKEHMRHLKAVLPRVREHRLFLQLSKCELAKKRANHLGAADLNR